MPNNTDTENSIDELGIPDISFELTPNTVTTQPTDKNLINDGQPADAKATGDRISEVEGTLADVAADVSTLMSASPDTVTKSMIDATLGTTGKVADAKATGDAISALETSTGEDIEALEERVNTKIETDIETAVGTSESDVKNALFPVGSVYMTTLSEIPEGMPGTWAEIALTASWNDLKNGTRNHAELPSGTVPGSVRFFLRTA